MEHTARDRITSNTDRAVKSLVRVSIVVCLAVLAALAILLRH